MRISGQSTSEWMKWFYKWKDYLIFYLEYFSPLKKECDPTLIEPWLQKIVQKNTALLNPQLRNDLDYGALLKGTQAVVDNTVQLLIPATHPHVPFIIHDVFSQTLPWTVMSTAVSLLQKLPSGARGEGERERRTKCTQAAYTRRPVFVFPCVCMCVLFGWITV